MFTCGYCKKSSKRNEKMNKVVIERPKTYPNGTVGHETEREIPICGVCLLKQPMGVTPKELPW